MLMWQFDHLWHLLNPLLELCVVALKWLTNLTYMLLSIFLQNHSVQQCCLLNSSWYTYITNKYKIFSFTCLSRTFHHEYFEWYVVWLLHVLKLFWWQNSVKSSQGDSHIRWFLHTHKKKMFQRPGLSPLPSPPPPLKIRKVSVCEPPNEVVSPRIFCYILVLIPTQTGV